MATSNSLCPKITQKLIHFIHPKIVCISWGQKMYLYLINNSVRERQYLNVCVREREREGKRGREGEREREREGERERWACVHCKPVP
jgi:hypothetical protein